MPRDLLNEQPVAETETEIRTETSLMTSLLALQALITSKRADQINLDTGVMERGACCTGGWAARAGLLTKELCEFSLCGDIFNTARDAPPSEHRAMALMRLDAAIREERRSPFKSDYGFKAQHAARIYERWMRGATLGC